MDRATALHQLPDTYAEVLYLRDTGLSDDAIASRLGVPAEATVFLLRLAEAKLAHLMADYEPGQAAEISPRPPDDIT